MNHSEDTTSSTRHRVSLVLQTLQLLQRLPTELRSAVRQRLATTRVGHSLRGDVVTEAAEQQLCDSQPILAATVVYVTADGWTRVDDSLEIYLTRLRAGLLDPHVNDTLLAMVRAANTPVSPPVSLN